MIKRTRRSGSVAVELLLLSPIVIGLILAVIEISMMTAANEHLAAASREGCRVAALGGNVNEVQRAVYNHLGYGSLAQAQITIIFLQDGQGNPLPVVTTLDENGNPTSSVQGNSSGQVSGSGQGNNSGNPIPHGEPVLVRLDIPAAAAVPDLLAIIGFSLKNQTLVGQTIMRKE